MSSLPQGPGVPRDDHSERVVSGPVRRVPLTETKASLKTTEFYLYLLAVIGVLVASAVTGDGPTDGGWDAFNAMHAWTLIAFLTVGYLFSRGLAKSGSRYRDDE